MEKIQFSQGQVKHILTDIAQQKDGYNKLLQLSLEALMQAERKAHNLATQDVSNGFRSRKSFGKGKILELQVPPTRHGQFYPLLLSIVKNQEEESRKNSL